MARDLELAGYLEERFANDLDDVVGTRKILYERTEGARSSRYASPARSDDLAGLPVTYLMVAEEDPLRDEALEFARRLLNANVSVDLRLFAGTYHGFDTVAPEARLSQIALEDQQTFLTREPGTA